MGVGHGGQILVSHTTEQLVRDAVNISPGVGEPRIGPPTGPRLRRRRATYGPEHYDATFQTGAAMTYDQAVEYTLRVLADVINETNQTHTT